MTPSTVASSDLQGAAILVIDGNEEHQILSVAALGRRGFRVSVADSGREGLQLASSQEYDAIVLAHKPKDAAGIDVLRSLQERFPQVPKIFLVPSGADDLALRGLKAGAAGYLMKTPRYHELLPEVVIEQITKARAVTKARDQTKVLEETRAQFRGFVEAAQDPIFVISPTGSFVAFNDATCAVTGYTHPELLRRNLFDLLSPRSNRESLQTLVDIEKDPPPGLEFALIRKDGREIFVSVTPHLVRRDGNVVGIEILAKDVTERKRTEGELRDLYAWLRAIYEATDDAILLADKDLRIVQWNARALDLFQVDSSGLSGTDAGILFRGLASRVEDPKPIHRAMKDYAANLETVTDGLVRLRGGAGHAYWHTSAPVRNPSGEIIGRLWIFRDVTEQRRADETQRAIYRISEATTTSRDLGTLFRFIHRIVGERMPARNFYVALYDEESDSFDFPYFVDENEAPPGRVKAGRGLTEYVLRTGRPMLVSPSVFQELLDRGEVDSVGPPSVDWLGVPLVGGDRIIGILAVQTYTEGVRYTPEDQEILTFVSTQVALAIERKMADEALRTSEERFRRLAEDAQDLIYRYRLVEPAGFEYVSPAATRLTGYTPEEHYADPDLGRKLVHPEDLPILESVLAGPPPVGEPVTLRWIHKDGSILWTEQRNVAVRDSAGRVIALEGIARDVTARIEAELAIRQSEERFRLLAKASKDAIWDWDRQTDTLTWSESIYDILGYEPAEVPPTGAWWNALIHPEDRESVLTQQRKQLNEGPDEWVAEYRVQRKDGSYAVVHDRGFILRDEDSRPVRMIGSTTDITEKTRAAEALRRRDAALAAVAFASDQLLRGARWEENIQETLRRLGEALQVSRAWLFRNHQSADGTLLTTQRAEWALAGIAPQIDNPALQGTPMIELGFRRWVETLGRGDMIQGHVRDFPASERDLLGSQGILSEIVVPIFVHGAWWGHIGFDECAEERNWTEGEIEALRAAAGTLAAAIERQQAEEAVRDSEERYRMLFEVNPHPMWVYDIETLRFLAVNDAAITHYGYSREEFLAMTIRDIRPPEDVPRLLRAVSHLEPGYHRSGQWRHVRKDGSVIDVEITSHVLVFAGRRADLVLVNDITQRKRAEEQVRYTANLVASVSDAIVAADLYMRITSWNRAAEIIYGWTSEEVLGRPTPEVLRTEFGSTREEAVLRAVIEEGAWSGEVTQRRKDGRRLHVLVSATLVRDAAGTAIGIVAVNRDVTDRREAEKALQESQRALQTLFVNLPGLAYRCRNNREWTMELVSDGVRELTGYEPSDLIGNRTVSYRSIIHADDQERVRNEIQTAVRKRQGFQLAYRIRSADGREKWVWEQGRGVYGDAAELLALEGFITDITERTRAREELERSEAKFRALFEAAAEAIVLMDGQGTILDVNPTGENLARRPRGDLIGSNLADLFPPEDLPRMRAYLRDILADRQTPDPFEAVIVVPPGERRSLEVRTRVLRRAGPDTRLEALVRDVTEEKELQQRLLRSERLASIGQLAAYIAHEINTPLTSISLLTASVARRVQEPELLEKLEKINIQRRQAAAIIADLLRFTSEREVHLRETDLREVVDLAIEQAQPYEKPGVTLQKESPSKPVLAKIDPLQIQEVLVNLLKNALEATPQGSVTLCLKATRDALSLSVMDTGAGMGPEVKARLFEPFFTTKRLGQGTGLGLALCHSIVSAHGGKIEVSTELGTGSTFTVLLPRRDTRRKS
ncbi:MAG: hypothetical protein A3K68_01920 [Euryarchaeota archaeon RBG_16_68_13]|nr:MAG: hypothetical protein A3K68_01920 [Euryarchaeota archaeon RBG_16_68_13]